VQQPSLVESMNIFEKLYQGLKIKYGKPKEQWSLWCKRPKNKKEREEVIIGAILTQRTNWKNVKLALGNLKKARMDSLKDIYRPRKRSLAPFIKPSGFYLAKAGYLFGLARFVIEKYKSIDKMRKVPIEKLREELLEIKGVGPETADSILLYALDKPVFVIDEYTRRLAKKRKLAKDLSYSSLQELFEKNLPRNCKLYQDFHALIIIDGKNSSRKEKYGVSNH